MDAKQEQKILKEVRELLLQLAMELEASAAAARKAAELATDADRQRAWPYGQQMYTRLSQANHLLQQFQSFIDDALKQENAYQKQMEKK
jgi:uncharacterized membrane protein YccC